MSSAVPSVATFVTYAKKVDGVVCRAEDGGYAVRLFRHDHPTSPTKIYPSTHGSYPTWRHARDVASWTVRWLNEVIEAHASVTEDDVWVILGRAEGSVERRHARYGVPVDAGY